MLCRTHGHTDFIKSGKNNAGEQKYKCRQCMKDLHKANYIKNKQAITERRKKYKEANPEKVRKIKNESARKAYNADLEKYRKARDERDRKNPQLKKDRQQRYQRRITQELDTKYIKDQLTRGTGLKYEDIPDSMVQLKKATMLIKRTIKDAHYEVKIQRTLEKINGIKNQRY